MNRDFIDMLSALCEAGVEFLVVGAHALAAHGAPLLDLTAGDLSKADTVFQIGLPPSRIDILSSISGVTFEDAWPRRVDVMIEALVIPVLGREDFIKNKKATGRPKDLSDLTLLPPA